MPQQSSEPHNIHAWRAGYRAYFDRKPMSAAADVDPVERQDWIAGFVRARTDRARQLRTAQEGGHHEE